MISISNVKTMLNIRNDSGSLQLPSQVDDHQNFSVLSSRSWESDSPLVTIQLYHDDGAESSEKNSSLAAKRHSWSAVYCPFHVEISDHETA